MKESLLKVRQKRSQTNTYLDFIKSKTKLHRKFDILLKGYTGSIWL